ncbi:unnamed protein product, partial [Darwinula stevensoni]
VKRRPRPLRTRPREADEEDDEDAEVLAKVEEAKELRRIRERPQGIDVLELAVGKKITDKEKIEVKDPFRTQTGGMVNMSLLKHGKCTASKDDAYDTGIGTAFSAETNIRDEDDEMRKYIEEEMEKRRGKKPQRDKEEHEQPGAKIMAPEEAALMAVPQHLRQAAGKKSEEMLSSQMLCGIPEVDLGLEMKIKNIEATEEAKQRLVRERMKKKDAPSEFVPTNMAVNFVQHNRYSLDEGGPPKHKRPVITEKGPKSEIVVGVDGEATIVNAPGNKRRSESKASDDFYFEKFKKQFRKY